MKLEIPGNSYEFIIKNFLELQGILRNKGVKFHGSWNSQELPESDKGKLNWKTNLNS